MLRKIWKMIWYRKAYLALWPENHSSSTPPLVNSIIVPYRDYLGRQKILIVIQKSPISVERLSLTDMRRYEKEVMISRLYFGKILRVLTARKSLAIATARFFNHIE